MGMRVAQDKEGFARMVVSVGEDMSVSVKGASASKDWAKCAYNR